jgi:ParB family chromosome partitioning protein
MNEDPSRRRLGRGLAALIGEIDKPEVIAEAKPVTTHDSKVPIEWIARNPLNPRRNFAEDELTDLAQSIKQHGVVQPIVVRPLYTNAYEIIAGERRWRAAQRAGLAEVPVIIRDVDDRTALELAIIENVQRSDLNPVEEARGYERLIDDHDYTQADLAEVIGKSRSHVANTLRLLRLPDDILEMVQAGAITSGHARMLVSAADPDGLARRIIDEGLSVRQVEVLAQQPARAQAGEAKQKEQAEKDANTVALEKLLSNITGLNVAISHKKKGGELRIAYRSLEQLDDLCRRLKSTGTASPANDSLW